MDRRLVIAGLGAASLLSVCAPRDARAELYKDEELGFSIQVPQGWRQIPLAAEEEYIVAKHQSDREYIDKKEGASMRPELKILLFDPKAKKSAEVSSEGSGVKRVSIKNPYKSFKDYVKADGAGGRYISKEEETNVNGLVTTWYEVAFEKLTVPRHGLAYVYHAEDIDYCAYLEVLEDSWQKVSPMLFQTLKSFKLIARTGSVKHETTGEGNVTEAPDLSKLTPEERAKLKSEKFERDLKKIADKLPDGWTIVRSAHYVAITHVEKPFTQKFLEQAEAVRDWLDTNLAFFGDGVPAPQLIRICKDRDEERSFTDLSARSGGWSKEITAAKETGLSDFRWVSSRLFERWLREKNETLAWSLPPWLSQGLQRWIGNALVRGGKLDFKSDSSTIVALKLAAKMKKLIGPKQMVAMSFDDMMEWDKKEEGSDSGMGGGPPSMMMNRASAYDQASGLVRYLLAGPGKSNAKTKDLIRAYIKNLEEVTKADKDSSGPGYTAPKTEEEEEERFKNRQSYYKDHEKDLLKAVFDKTFSEWTDADWASIEKSYTAFAS